MSWPSLCSYWMLQVLFNEFFLLWLSQSCMNSDSCSVNCSPQVVVFLCYLFFAWTVVLEKTLESPLDSKEIQPVLGVHWKDWCWSWNSNTLATSCEELTHWKRPWCWEGLGAGGEGDDRGWDGWMASPTQRTWVCVNSGSWWWTGRPGMLWFMGSQRVGHDWVTELNWTELNCLQNIQEHRETSR